MEVDLEIHDQDQDQEQRGTNQSTTTRSYECTFCQRGFTNAQALGGHMNLHRKDKARLKQSASISSSSSSASKNKMPWDIPKIPTSPSLAAVGGGGGENATLTTTEETLIGHDVRQLPLFIEKPSNMDQELESQYQTVQPPEIVSDQKTVLPDDSEVDLELRLGPEPQNSTSSSASIGSISTKQFF